MTKTKKADNADEAVQYFRGSFPPGCWPSILGDKFIRIIWEDGRLAGIEEGIEEVKDSPEDFGLFANPHD